MNEGGRALNEIAGGVGEDTLKVILREGGQIVKEIVKTQELQRSDTTYTKNLYHCNDGKKTSDIKNTKLIIH